MPIKLSKQDLAQEAEKELGSILESEGIASEGIGDVISAQAAPLVSRINLMVDKGTIKEMVTGYRVKHSTTDPNYVKFIHFNLKEVLQLFIDNGIIKSADSVASQLNNLQFYGLKIYMGTHTAEDNCPVNPDPTKPNPYLGRDTAILCNTELDVPSRTWKDQLKDTTPGVSSVSVLGTGDGLDQGSICPPDCPGSPDPNGYLTEDILP